MKKIKFYMLAALAVITTTCDKEKDGLGEQNQMFITTSRIGGVVIYAAGSGTMTINWGDGTNEETHALQSYDSEWAWESNQAVFHSYSSGKYHTITIIGDNVTHIACPNEELSYLDVRKNKALEYLSCSYNSLRSLDVSENSMLTQLFCRYNEIKDLDVSKNTKLEILFCGETLISSLDVSRNIELSLLNCESSQLINLDVSKNTKLVELQCNSNPLTQLNAGNNPSMTTLVCSDCRLNSLDVSGLTSLTHLECGSYKDDPDSLSNRITSLKVNDCISLSYLNCQNNQLSREALNSLFETLNATTISYGKDILISNNPGANDCDKSIAENKGWYVTNIFN